MSGATEPLLLEATSGPRPLAVRLAPDGPHLIGRGANVAVLLSDTGNTVSREQATLAVERHAGERRWCISAISDRVPTRLNGIILSPAKAVPLQDNDLITIGPYTLQVVPEGQTSLRRRQTHDDRATASSLRPIRQEDLPSLGRDWLRPLLRLAEELHAADSRPTLARAVTETLADATRYGNVAYTTPLGADGSVDVLAARTADGGTGDGFSFSRSILREAALTGEVVHRTRGSMPTNIEVSIFALDISEAVCVPVKSGDVVVGLIYMDNRKGTTAPTGGDEDLAFAVALGRLASLAMHGLLNREVNARLAKMQGELAAAAEVQRLILPAGDGTVGSVVYAGRCDAGQVMSGDFFDMIDLEDGRVAVAIGDSCGHGIVASVLATLVQGFLRGMLANGGTVAAAATALNGYLSSRADTGKFLTAWIGVIDPARQEIEYVDAGHGFAVMVRPDEPVTQLSGAGGPPLGAVEQSTYDSARVPFPTNATLVLASDGVIEQRRPSGEQFGVPGFRDAIGQGGDPGQIVPTVLDAVRAFAAKPLLDDDATVVAVRRR